jgi:hypothetical protein
VTRRTRPMRWPSFDRALHRGTIGPGGHLPKPKKSGIDGMADEHTIPPFASDGVDASVGTRAADTARTAAKGIGNAIKESRRPGMPLDILANATREAPLGALLAAFLLGVIVARR